MTKKLSRSGSLSTIIVAITACMVSLGSPVCPGSLPPASEIVCDDGVDGDGDGAVDCYDDDCAGDDNCIALPEDCTDGKDNDFDGDTDCADSDCADDPACTSADPCPTAKQATSKWLTPGNLGFATVVVGNPFIGSDGVAMATSTAENDITCQGAGTVSDTDVTGDLSCVTAGEYRVTCPGGTQAALTGDGDHVVVVMQVAAPVPLTDATHFYQYGFVFETDGDSANDWAPYPSYPKDFFADTDLWYELDYDPSNDWQLHVSEIGAGNQITERTTSHARVIIHDDVLILIVPVSELGTGALRFRTTTFKHLGNYLADPWNGDADPFVDDGLRTVP